jgi:hypothetical protein
VRLFSLNGPPVITEGAFDALAVHLAGQLLRLCQRQGFYYFTARPFGESPGIVWRTVVDGVRVIAFPSPYPERTVRREIDRLRYATRADTFASPVPIEPQQPTEQPER